METIFQKILDGEIPADKVYEDEHTFAFLDIKPVQKGHTLVIPKQPVRDIFDLPEEAGAHLMRTIRNVAHAVKDSLSAEGVNVISNNGAAAGQEVFHLHFHIIPRFGNDQIGSLPRLSYENDEEREETANRIAEKLK